MARSPVVDPPIAARHLAHARPLIRSPGSCPRSFPRSSGARSPSSVPARSRGSHCRAARRSTPRGCSPPRCAATPSRIASTASSSRRRCSRSTRRARRPPSVSTTAATSCRPIAGSSSATISLRSPGPGPLVGPTLAAQFGYLPGTIWIIVGVALGGAVQDFVILASSVRRDGKSLGQMARRRSAPSAAARAGRRARDHDRAASPCSAWSWSTRCKTSPWGTVTIGRRFRSRCSWASTCAGFVRAACSRRPRSASCCSSSRCSAAAGSPRIRRSRRCSR